jgi:hypothetical protein
LRCAKSLKAAMRLLRGRAQNETIDGFCRTLWSVLHAMVNNDEQAIRKAASAIQSISMVSGFL